MAGTVRLIGCLHLGHLGMARYRGFQDEYYYNEHLIESWNKIVSPKDITYILGDITMESNEFYYELDRLNGIKHVVLGNHDKRQHVRELLNYVDTVSGMIDYKGCALTHCPIHPSELSFYRANIHAHIHHINKLEDVKVMDRYGDVSKDQYSIIHKYINVDAKLLDYKPRTLNELLEERNL